MANNISDLNFEAIAQELQKASERPEFQAEAEKLAGRIQNIERFYSIHGGPNKGQFDQAKWEQYPLDQIMENASKLPKDKII